MESLSTSHNICVAVDGSEASHTAFEVITQTILQQSDILSVAHVFNKEKTYLPFTMQPDHIR